MRGVVVERDDGFVFQEGGRDFYGAPFRRWEPHERRGLRFARGRVLDAGCGSGPRGAELQRRGRDVVGIDISPLAIEAARRLGVRDARVLALADADAELGSFDSIVLYGNNLGLLESPAKARRILRRLQALTSARGRIVGSSMDIAAAADADHRAYVARNIERGRPPGQRPAPGSLPQADRPLVRLALPGEDRARRAARGQRLASRSLSRRARRPLRRRDREGLGSVARTCQASGGFGFRAREGCTRFGSPGIFGKFGGYGASPTPSRSSRSTHSSSAPEIAHGLVDPLVQVAALGEAGGHRREREVLGLDLGQLLPRDGCRHGRVDPTAHRVGRGDRPVARVLVVVDEDPLAPLLLPPRRRDELGVAPLDFARERQRARRTTGNSQFGSIRHATWIPRFPEVFGQPV